MEDHQTPDRRPDQELVLVPAAAQDQDLSPVTTRNLHESETWGRPPTTATVHLPPPIQHGNQELQDEVPQLCLPGDIQYGKVCQDLQDEETTGVH